MLTGERARLIWGAMAIQFLGYVIDVAWHGFLGPGGEPATRADMVRHLATVHLPLYVGAASVLIATALALWRRRRETGVALAIAFGGAVLSAAGEAWHAVSHLRLDTHGAPVAGTLSIAGFLVVLAALLLAPGETHGGEAKARRAAHR